MPLHFAIAPRLGSATSAAPWLASASCGSRRLGHTRADTFTDDEEAIPLLRISYCLYKQENVTTQHSP